MTDRPVTRKNFTRVAWSILKAVVSIALMLVLFFVFDWSEAWEAAREVPLAVLFAGLCLFLVGHILTAVRLHLIISVHHTNQYLNILKAVFVGLFSSNFLPSTVGGDVVKVAMIKDEESGYTFAISSVIFDRAINIVGIALLLPAGFSLYNVENSSQLIGSSLWSVGLILGVLIIGAALVGVFVAGSSRLEAYGKRFGWFSRFLLLSKQFIRLVRDWITYPQIILASIILSCGAIFVSTIGLWLVVSSLTDVVTLVQMLGIVVLNYLITLTPVSLNGLGLQEVTIAFLLRALGVTPDVALALSLIIRLIYVSATLPGALLLLFERSPATRVDPSLQE